MNQKIRSRPGVGAGLIGLVCLAAVGCSGARQSGGEEQTPPARTTDTELVLLSFAAVQGELLECG